MKFLKNILMSLVGMSFIHTSLIAINPPVYDEDGMIEEAFVTYSDRNFFPLVEVLLESVKAFSTRPIVVVGINDDVPFSTEKYPFMIKKRIDIGRSSRETIFFAKPRAMLEAGVKRGVYVDADIVLNDGCDVLFEHCKKDVDYPLGPKFPWLVDNQQPVMQVLGVTEKSIPYVHACLFVFNEKCLPFFKEWRQCNIDYGHLAVVHDETMLNVLLWKHGATQYINLCEPYYALFYDYQNGGTRQHQQHGYKDWVGKIDFLSFHGCKNAREAMNILNALIERKQKASQ